MNKYLKTAEKAARKAGDFLLNRFRGELRIDKKGEIDLVTDVDRQSESIIKEIIQSDFPDHQILAEESDNDISDPEYLWLIDPLDGTTNYAHGFPVFCVSIALRDKSGIVSGCIYNPILDEFFHAERGSGSFLNGKPISVSRTESIDNALLATGFPYDIRDTDEDNIREFTAFAKSARAVRRAGSAALDLAYVACGRFDGFWEFKLSPWDLGAGVLLVTEAGGTVSSYSGDECDIFTGEAAASNGFIHSSILEILKKTRA